MLFLFYIIFKVETEIDNVGIFGIYPYSFEYNSLVAKSKRIFHYYYIAGVLREICGLIYFQVSAAMLPTSK